MIERTIGVTELQRHFRKVLDEVVHEGTPYILTRGSRPQAAVIPYEEYVRFREEEDRRLMERMDQVLERLAARNAHFTEEEIAADIEAAREEVYQEELNRGQVREAV